MKLQLQSNSLEDYLCPIEGVIDFDHPVVNGKIKEIKGITTSLEKQAEIAFNYVRDNIEHSFDTNSIEITISASDAIEKRSEEHTSELQSRGHLVCRLLLEKKKKLT